MSCLTTTDTRGCSITDNSCLCRNYKFVADQAACVAQAFTNPSDLQQADTFAQQNCLAVLPALPAQLDLRAPPQILDPLPSRPPRPVRPPRTAVALLLSLALPPYC
ncbi:hypothetical protein JB92DRAFT_2954255 [Gautieria morchelliformis]|nr:hypothetical protein JB92DRAFT_2954255 [Gautieria morchelliformis]